MNSKKLMLLTVIAFIVIGVAIQLTTQVPMSEQTATSKLFPTLVDKLNEVDTIEVSTSGDKFTVRFADGKWGLVDKQGYPVKEENVRNVLLGMANLVILEAKTQKSENYPQLGVQDVIEKNADSTLLSLKQGDTVISRLIVGYDRIARSDNKLREIYVRKPGEAQSWVVEGLLSLEKQAKDWLETDIINVTSNRIREAVISEDGTEVVRIFKQNVDDNDYQIANLPENAKISSHYSVNQIAQILTDLDMEDVTVSDTIGDGGRNVVLTTYDGLQVTLDVLKRDDVFYAKFAAAYVEPVETEKDKFKSVEEVKKEVTDLNEKLASWVYILPRYKANYLFKQPSDLYKIEVETEEVSNDEPISSLEDALSNVTTTKH